ncbi:hypothetical protein Droror1_Dr00001347 [Drosera rotundifolia]
MTILRTHLDNELKPFEIQDNSLRTRITSTKKKKKKTKPTATNNAQEPQPTPRNQFTTVQQHPARVQRTQLPESQMVLRILQPQLSDFFRWGEIFLWYCSNSPALARVIDHIGQTLKFNVGFLRGGKWRRRGEWRRFEGESGAVDGR